MDRHAVVHFQRNRRVGSPALLLALAILFFTLPLPVSASESSPALDRLKPATADSASSYGGIVIDEATTASMTELLGKPLSTKGQSYVWIGSDGCRQLGLKMVRAKYTEDSVLTQMTLDLREPLLRAEAVEKLALGAPAETRTAKDLTLELFLPANLAFGIHGDQIVRLFLFGGSTPGMRANLRGAAPGNSLPKTAEDVAPPTPAELDEALRQATGLGQIEYAGQLLALGARAAVADQRGRTSLHHAASAGSTALIPMLAFAWAQQARAATEQDAPALVSMNPFLDQQDNDGATALLLACFESKFETAQALLRLGADPNLGNKQGQRPLHLAALNDQLSLAEALLLAQADVFLRNQRGYTPRDLATDDGVRQLLTQAAARAGVDPEEARVREVMETFLRASREGDAAGMKAVAAAALQNRLPDSAEKVDVAWKIEHIAFGPATATVRCRLSAPDGQPEGKNTTCVFQLKYGDSLWRITEIKILIESAGTSVKGTAP